MNNKRSILYTIIAIFVLLGAVVSATYSYISKGKTLDSGNFSFTIPTTPSFSSIIDNDLIIDVDVNNMKSSNVGWSTSKNATITLDLFGSDGSYCTYSIIVENKGDVYTPLTGTGSDAKGGGLYLKTAWNGGSKPASATYNSLDTTLNYTTETEYGLVNNIVYNGVIAITSGGKAQQKINVSLIWKNLPNTQVVNTNKTFKATLRVDNITCKNEDDKTTSTYVSPFPNTLIDSMLKNEYGVDNVNEAITLISQKTAPNFNNIATTNEGIFKTVDDDGDVYYYRGSVDNNHVIFGNFCWKIVRTTGTGGVKLIYDGIPAGGVCNNTSSNSQIGTSEFNSNDDDTAYVGYMYGDINSSSLDENGKFKNTYDSTAKTAVDNWFRNNLLDDYSSYLEDTIFCNDRSVASTSGSTVYFGAEDRLYFNKSPSLICPQANDKFTVSSSRGNGDLTYPVGLLTADEIALAGGKFDIDNNNIFLYAGEIQWSLSPSRFYNGNASVWYLHSLGFPRSTYVHYSFGLRPVVSLKPGTQVSGGNGTSNTPYIIE